MSKRIFKYEIGLGTVFDVPHDFKPLSVAYQGTVLTLWAEVDVTGLHHTVSVTLAGTGHQYEDGDVGEFIGTVFQPGLPLVWHVFVKVEAQ